MGASALIALSSSQIVQMGANSKAYCERLESGEIRVKMQAGTLSFRKTSGETSTVAAGAVVVFDQRRAGLKVGEARDGVVAVVAPASGEKGDRVEEGQKEVPVNDGSKIDPTREILLRTSLSRQDPDPEEFLQEVKCRVESVRDNILTLSQPLNFPFSADDLIIQRSGPVEQFLSTRLRQAAEPGDEILHVVDSKRVDPLEQIVVQSPDGRIREVCCVQYGREELYSRPELQDPQSTLKLANGLQHSFEGGAEIVQGVRYRQEAGFSGRIEYRLELFRRLIALRGIEANRDDLVERLGFTHSELIERKM